MFRPSASPRLLAGFALAAVVGGGAGLGLVGVGSPSGTATPPTLHDLAAAATTAPAIPSTPLSADQAKAVALEASPGTVVDVEQENGTTDAADPNEATDAPDPAGTSDPADARDPADASDPADATEPTGLSYDVTVLHHDGTTTEIVVDGATGRVVSTKAGD